MEKTGGKQHSIIDLIRSRLRAMPAMHFPGFGGGTAPVNTDFGHAAPGYVSKEFISDDWYAERLRLTGAATRAVPLKVSNCSVFQAAVTLRVIFTRFH